MRAVGLVLLAVCLAGCSTVVAGTPAEDTSEPLDVKAVLGEFTTVDPCSLVDPKTLREFGDAKLATPNSFEYCSVGIGSDIDDRIEVMVGQLSSVGKDGRKDYDHTRTLAGGLWVAEIADEDAGYCDQPLVFADGTAIGVNVWAYGDDPPGNLCDIADVAMRQLVSVVRAGTVRHREYPKDSFATIDPCELVYDDILATVPGYASAKEEGYPAKHVCTWRVGGEDDPSVQLTLGVGPPLDDATENITGRPSLVEREPDLGGKSWCQIDTEHIRFEAASAKDARERASVDAYGPAGAIDQACAAARAVAEEAWWQLPMP